MQLPSPGHLGGLEVLLHRKWKSNDALKRPGLHVFHDSIQLYQLCLETWSPSFNDLDAYRAQFGWNQI